MAVTATRLYQASQLTPAMLGDTIVNPDGTATFEQQEAAAIAWVQANVLDIADSEVSVPFLEATGFDTVDEFVQSFSGVAQATRNGWITKGQALYDGAVLSYGRSEVNKSIASNAASYDKDSDQDRIQGNQRLAKLTAWAAALIASQEAATSVPDEAPEPESGSVPFEVRWW